MKKINGLEVNIYKKRIVNISVSTSSLRNQGGKGLIKKTRKLLIKTDLAKFCKGENKFKNYLENETKRLTNNAKIRFGAARKSLNIFLLQSSLDRVLSKYYNLGKILKYLELPLDSYTIKHLKKEAKKRKYKLPRWDGIRNLEEKSNALLQQFALKLAKEKRIPRAYLDLIYWRKDIKK